MKTFIPTSWPACAPRARRAYRRDEQLRGSDDLTVMRRAHAAGRVVVTHDSDFGKLVVHDGEPFIGILFLRPGHISPDFVLGALSALDASSITVTPPFLAVVERKDDQVRVRVRSLS